MAENITTDDLTPTPFDTFPEEPPSGIFFVKKGGFTILSFSPSTVGGGDTENFTITGTGFHGDATIDLGEDVTVDNFSVDDSETITGQLTVGASPTLGNRDVTVTNPSGASRVLSDAYEITEEGAGVYFTDFSENDIDAFPAGFSLFVEDSDDDSVWSVKEDLTGVGGKVLSVIGGTVTENLNSIIKWDAIDSDPDRNNADMLIKIKRTGRGISNGPVIRTQSHTNALTGYCGFVTGASNATPQLRRFVNSSSGDLLDNDTMDMASDTWYYLRFNVDGSSLKVKQWLASESEPGTWNLDLVDALVEDIGAIGLMHLRASEVFFDIFSVATGTGVTAPLTDPNA